MIKLLIFILFFSISYGDIIKKHISPTTKINFIWNHIKNPILTKKIEKNPSFLNYLIIASYYAKDEKSSLILYKNLIQTIPSNEITSFGNMLDIFTNQYQYSFDYIYKTFIFLNKSLSKKQLDLLIEYPETLSLFFYKSNIKNIKQHQKLLLFLYKNLYKKYKFHKNYKKIVLVSFYSTAIYMINQSNQINSIYFKKVFSFLIRNNFFDSLLIDKKICKNRKNFAIFAKNGIIHLIKFYKYNNKIFYQFAQYSHNLPSLMFIVNIYTKFDKKNWNRFKDLLTSLTNNIYYNTIILSKLYKLGYFKLLKNTKDADIFVHIDSKDLSSIPAKKYKYILFTSLGNQNSGKNLLYKIITNDKNITNNIKFLLSKTPEELAKHLFTNKDKIIYYFHKVDIIVTGISIALVIAPLSANGISYVIANEIKHTGTTALQYALKESIKKSLIDYKNNYIFTEFKTNHSFKIYTKNMKKRKFALKSTIADILVNNNYKPKLLCK